jgi:hypothetical protein
MMMYYLWMLHYSLVKRIYRKRIKGIKKGADSLAFLCLFLLILFILVLLTNKALLGKIIGSHVTLAPIGGAIAVIILIPLLFLCRGLTSKKIGVLRRVIIQTRNVKHIYSVLYVSFLAALYILTIVVPILTIPHHHR